LKLLGWQVTHRDHDHPPVGMRTYEVYTYNAVMTLIANFADRPEWRLLPVYEGDVDEPKMVHWDVQQALAFAHRHNAALSSQ
jgi:hypothetical protein